MKIAHRNHNVEFTICIVAALIGVGLIMAYSTTVIGPGSVSDNMGAVIKHVVWIFIGAISMIVLSFVDYRHFKKHYLLLLVVGLLGLAFVLIPGVGVSVNGARRWIRFSSFLGFQPSDLSKICLLIFLSAYIEKNDKHIKEFVKGFGLPILVVAGYAGLLMLEPDFGTTAFILMVSVSLLLIGGTRIIFMILSLVAASPLIYTMLNESYRWKRVLIYLDPWKDSDGAGYQIIQSLIALGSGGVFGKGLGASRQKLNFLPESNNDFILTIIGEEIGFVGVFIVITLFGLLVWNGIKICKSAPDLFGFLMAFGITFMIGLQAAINIAVVSAAVPTKGIPLPFISAGGSSLIISMASIGILVSIGKQGSLDAKTQ